MRLLRTVLLAFPLVILAACGGAKATVTPVPSAAVLPVTATETAIATLAAPGITQIATALGVPAPLVTATSASPTTSAAAPAVRATAVPTKPAAVSATASPRASQAAATPVQSAKTERVANIPLDAPQQMIGTASDGLTLLNVRTGKNDGFTRLVFDLSKQDGSAAPVPRTRLWVQGSTVIVAFGGVRDDQYAASLGSAEQHVDLGTVQSIYRIPVRDDAASAYGIAVSGSTRVTLSATTLPTRVIVDVADK
jgi:hypothetical protein